MKKTVIIDVLNEKVLKLLQDLELLSLIHVHAGPVDPTIESKYLNPVSKFKGAMTKQPMSEIESQINQLRSEWD